jgi:hypothetical protein
MSGKSKQPVLSGMGRFNDAAPTSPPETISDPLSNYKSPPSPERTTSRPASKLPSWVTATLEASKSDSRRQPWKEMFGESVDCRFDDGEDLVRIEKSVGGKFDPDCPFRTQGSSLAA